jgi:hypothetical protein
MVPPEPGLRQRSLLSRLFNGDGVYVGAPLHSSIGPSARWAPAWRLLGAAKQVARVNKALSPCAAAGRVTDMTQWSHHSWRDGIYDPKFWIEGLE